MYLHPQHTRNPPHTTPRRPHPHHSPAHTHHATDTHIAHSRATALPAHTHATLYPTALRARTHPCARRMLHMRNANACDAACSDCDIDRRWHRVARCMLARACVASREHIAHPAAAAITTNCAARLTFVNIAARNDATSPKRDAMPPPQHTRTRIWNCDRRACTYTRRVIARAHAYTTRPATAHARRNWRAHQRGARPPRGRARRRHRQPQPHKP